MCENGSIFVLTLYDKTIVLILFLFFRYVTKSWDIVFDIAENYEGKILSTCYYWYSILYLRVAHLTQRLFYYSDTVFHKVFCAVRAL
jgi:hypothetical protein